MYGCRHHNWLWVSCGCETLWPPPHLPPLKNSCCEPVSNLFSVNKNPLQRVKKKYFSYKINYDVYWEINTPSVTYGHQKSVSVNLFVCLIAYIPTFRKFWGLCDKLMVKKNKTKQKPKHQVYMMWFRSPCDLPVNVVLAGKKCTLSWTNLLQQKCFFWERETIFYWTGLSFCSRFFLWCTWRLREKNSFVMIISVVMKMSSQKYNSRCFFFPFFKMFFYCRRCRLFMLLRTDYGSWDCWIC